MKHKSLLAPLFAAIAAAFLSQTGLAAEATSEPTQAEALKQATATFNTYIAQCEGKSYAQISDRQFIEFSSPFKGLGLKYDVDLEEHERLNGIVWSGLFVADLGQSARMIFNDIMGGVTTKEWQKTKPVTFRHQLKNGHWEIATYTGKTTADIDVNMLYWEVIKPGAVCPKLPTITAE